MRIYVTTMRRVGCQHVTARERPLWTSSSPTPAVSIDRLVASIFAKCFETRVARFFALLQLVAVCLHAAKEESKTSFLAGDIRTKNPVVCAVGQSNSKI